MLYHVTISTPQGKLSLLVHSKSWSFDEIKRQAIAQVVDAVKATSDSKISIKELN